MQKPIEQVSLQTRIIKYIQEYIQEHKLQPGDKLPSQGALSDMMGVSRTALREAVKTLEAEAVIEVKNGKGIYVGRSQRPQDAFSSVLAFNNEKEQLLEVVEVRQALESEILAMVIRKATDAELNELGKIEAILMQKFHAGQRQVQEDHQFHQQIYELCHNKIMAAMIKLLNDKMDALWEFPLNMTDPFRESMPYHHDLYLAICERNIHKAQAINTKLLGCVYADLVHQTIE
ncbi:FadR family transcriptional regulator [Oscillospiraceae bacterium HV4-5-C5C]|nr:FadR family transcriptional regulator [Oscillospiraceae bacterium HV4-5-C5C]